jgi:hypothetical protein
MGQAILTHRQIKARGWDVFPQPIRFEFGLHIAEECGNVLLLHYPCPFRCLLVIRKLDRVFTCISIASGELACRPLLLNVAESREELILTWSIVGMYQCTSKLTASARLS